MYSLIKGAHLDCEKICNALLARPEKNGSALPERSIPPVGGDFQGMGSTDLMCFYERVRGAFTL